MRSSIRWRRRPDERARALRGGRCQAAADARLHRGHARRAGRARPGPGAGALASGDAPAGCQRFPRPDAGIHRSERGRRGSARRGIATHEGAVLLFEADTGRLSPLMNGATITAIRTAAVSGVATDVLARPDAAELAILGAGVQGRTHLEAIAAVRRLKRARIW